MSHKVDLVRVLTSATGNSTPITLGAAYSQLFMTTAEAGAIDGRTYTWLIVDGNNWELVKGVYTASGTTMARTTVLASRISGTIGTSRISLSGTAQVRIIAAAEDMDGVRGTRSVTGTSDTLANTDQGYVVTYSNASAIAVSLGQAGASSLFLDGWATWVQNLGAGTVTITPATSTINGGSTLVLAQNLGAFIWSDGTNYHAYIIPITKPLLAANNLSDVSNIVTARSNIEAAPFDALAYNNIIINGGMEVDQANAGAAINGISGVYTADGWIVSNGSTSGVVSIQQVSDAPPGFSNSLKVTVGTAQASLNAGDSVSIQQRVEGYRASKLGYGAAGAQSSTLGFWTKHHRTGLWSGSLRNFAASRSYPFTYTQAVADTWQYNTITVPGDTAGAWTGNTNGASHQVFFAVAVGSTLSGSPGSWQAANYTAATGAVNGIAATSDVFQITGVSWLPGTEAGSAARSPLLKLAFDQALMLCKRYWESNFSYGTSPAAGVTLGRAPIHNYGAGATDTGINLTFKVSKRISPTMTNYNSVGSTATATFDNVGTEGGNMFVSSMAAGSVSYHHYVADARL